MVARICREAGGRVTTNVFVRNLDLVGPGVEDNRRLEVVADGLPLFGGPIGDRHDSGQEEGSNPRRSGDSRGPTQEMPDLPQVGWAARKGAPRGPRCGSWRSLVARNPKFSVTVGQS